MILLEKVSREESLSFTLLRIVASKLKIIFYLATWHCMVQPKGRHTLEA